MPQNYVPTADLNDLVATLHAGIIDRGEIVTEENTLEWLRACPLAAQLEQLGPQDLAYVQAGLHQRLQNDNDQGNRS